MIAFFEKSASNDLWGPVKENLYFAKLFSENFADYYRLFLEVCMFLESTKKEAEIFFSRGQGHYFEQFSSRTVRS